MITVVFTIECHCGADATKTTTYLDQPEQGGKVRIDVEMAACGSTFECGNCGCMIYTGDLTQEWEPYHCPDEDEGEGGYNGDSGA